MQRSSLQKYIKYNIEKPNLVEEQDEVDCERHKQRQHPEVVEITSQIVLQSKNEERNEY